MNDCEKKGCSACGLGSNPDGLPCIEGQTSHPEVTDVKNRELLLFLLVIVIMIVIAIVGAVVVNRLSNDNSLDNQSAAGCRGAACCAPGDAPEEGAASSAPTQYSLI